LRTSLIATLVLSAVVSLQAQKVVIAITDVDAEGLSNFDIKRFVNKLESELVSLGTYEVTSRQEVEQILKEQQFQQAGCTDQSCAAQIGRMLNADLMLMPSVLYDSKSGDISVTLKLVDVETARIKTSITKDATVDRVKEINDLLQDYLIELYRKESGETAIPTLPGTAGRTIKTITYGNLDIRTNPSAVKIVIDNEEQGFSPKLFEQLETGVHSLVLTYPGYEPLKKSVLVTEGETAVVNELLVLKTGNLFIESIPPRAEVFLNNQFRGNSPLELKGLPIGEHNLRVEFEKYYDFTKSITIEPNQTSEENIQMLPKPGRISVITYPGGSDIIVNGKTYTTDSGGMIIIELTAGRHQLTIAHDGYAVKYETVTVEPGDDKTSIVVNLEKKLTTEVKIKTIQSRVTIEYVDIAGRTVTNKTSFSGGLSLDLLSGDYVLKASKKGYKSDYRNISIKPNQRDKEIVSFYLAKEEEKAKEPISKYKGDGLIFYFNYPSITFNNSTFEKNLDEGVIQPAGGFGFGFEYRGGFHLFGSSINSAYLDLEGFGLDSTTLASFYSVDVYYMFSPIRIAGMIPSIGLGYQESSISMYLDLTSSIITSRPYYLIDLRIDLMNKSNTAGWGVGYTYKKSFESSFLAAQLTYPEKDRDWSQSNIYVHLLGEWALLPCYCVIALLGAALGG